jgi:hypothetical protein
MITDINGNFLERRIWITARLQSVGRPSQAGHLPLAGIFAATATEAVWR